MKASMGARAVLIGCCLTSAGLGQVTNGGFEDQPDPLNGWETKGNVSVVVNEDDSWAVLAEPGDAGRSQIEQGVPAT